MTSPPATDTAHGSGQSPMSSRYASSASGVGANPNGAPVSPRSDETYRLTIAPCGSFPADQNASTVRSHPGS